MNFLKWLFYRAATVLGLLLNSDNLLTGYEQLSYQKLNQNLQLVFYKQNID